MIPMFQLFNDLHQELEFYPTLGTLKTKVMVRSCGHKWCIVDNLFIVDGRIYVLSTSLSLSMILTSVHGMG
jgi:hypothetical protein